MWLEAFLTSPGRLLGTRGLVEILEVPLVKDYSHDTRRGKIGLCAGDMWGDKMDYSKEQKKTEWWEESDNWESVGQEMAVASSRKGNWHSQQTPLYFCCVLVHDFPRFGGQSAFPGSSYTEHTWDSLSHRDRCIIKVMAEMMEEEMDLRSYSYLPGLFFRIN